MLPLFKGHHRNSCICLKSLFCVDTMALSKSNIRVILLSSFYILYLVIGGAIFSAIEGPAEREIVQALKSTRQKFLTDHKCMTGIYKRFNICFVHLCVCVDQLLTVLIITYISYVSGVHNTMNTCCSYIQVLNQEVEPTIGPACLQGQGVHYSIFALCKLKL